ncbi:hypothetical protein ACLOJK_021455 [Asimina triloba]
MEISLENLEARGAVSPSDGCSMQPSDSFKGSENFGSDSVFYEKFLLEDLDSYMEDINVRLTISRMVSDSIIKGMVSAVSDEASEKIALKEAEISSLKTKLHSYESGSGEDREFWMSSAADETNNLKSEMLQSSFDLQAAGECGQNFDNLKLAAEEQFHRLAEGIRDMSEILVEMDSGVKQQGDMSEILVEMDQSISRLKNIFRLVCEDVDTMVSVPNVSVYEQKWENEFQQEIEGIVFQSYIRSLHEDFEKKLQEQRNCLLEIRRKKWITKVKELASLREELDIISRSLSVPEPGKLLFHGSHEVFEEWATTERKDWIHQKVWGNNLSQSVSIKEENGHSACEKSYKSNNSMPDIFESAQLKHMTWEELITYFNTEITKMKRNHELAVREITEEYFTFRRESLKEKGSSHLRKEKDLEGLRKKIPEVILKLDDILEENEKLVTASDDYESICMLKDKIENLVIENQRLRDMLADKRKEIKCLSSQVSEAANKMAHHSRTETSFLKKMLRLKCDMEDLKIDAFIQEEIHKILLRELTGKMQHDMCDTDVEAILMHEISAILFREAVKDANSAVGLALMKSSEARQKIIHLEAAVLEKEKALHSEVEEKEKLKKDLASLTALTEEKEKLVSDVGSQLMNKNERLELVCKELQSARDHVKQQERLISENNKESNSIKSRLTDALEQIRLYKVKIGSLDKKLEALLDAQRDAEKQRSILNTVVQEKQSMIVSAIQKEQKQKRQMESIVISVQELSKVMVDFECKVTEKFMENSARLEMLKTQSKPIVQQGKLLHKKEFVYRQALERRRSDLQKAEAEVDLLGDEVDSLLHLLEKLYIVLDHYSPILQHYTGVMEVLELVRRELKGERSKSI